MNLTFFSVFCNSNMKLSVVLTSCLMVSQINYQYNFHEFSAYFCVRKRSPRGSSGGGASNSSVPVLAGNSNQLHMQQHHSGPGSGKAFSVEYSTNNANVTIRDSVSVLFIC